MNVETAELTQTGKMKFGHRSGTHDDRLWGRRASGYGARNPRKEIDYTIYFSRQPDEFHRPIADLTKKGDVPPGNGATCTSAPDAENQARTVLADIRRRMEHKSLPPRRRSPWTVVEGKPRHDPPLLPQVIAQTTRLSGLVLSSLAVSTIRIGLIAKN